MDETTRFYLVYAILGAIVVIGVPVAVIALRKRKRQKLRQRGIKTYGH